MSDLPIVGPTSLETLLAAVFGFFIAKSVATAVIRWWTSGVVVRASALTSARLFAAYMRAPIEFHDQKNSSELVRNTNSTVSGIYSYGIQSMASILAEGATLVVLVLVVLLTAPIPGIVGVVYFTVASVVFLRIFQRRTRSGGRRLETLNAESVRFVQEGIGGLRAHRLRGTESSLADRYRTNRFRSASLSRFLAFSGELPRYYLEVLFIGGFAVISAVVVGSGSGESVLPTLAVLLGVGLRILPSISRLLAAFTNIRISRGGIEVILGDLDQLGINRLRDIPRQIESIQPLDSSPVAMEFREVNFSYPSAVRPALESISLRIDAGTSIGIAGSSGAGKSTLVDLLCALRVPSSGSIYVDGERLDPEDPSWRRRIGLVPQDVFLLDDTIRGNVSFGMELDDDGVWQALGGAQLDEFVRSLPAGLDTVIGERGTRLSGGQRQRIGIARALCGRPGLLVLDEATSALDMETEKAVVDSISALEGAVTLVVIAHRLSTIRRCDTIVYLDNGRIAAQGTFDEVANAVPEFARAVTIAGLDGGEGS